jgi:hypothetical protein
MPALPTMRQFKAFGNAVQAMVVEASLVTRDLGG